MKFFKSAWFFMIAGILLLGCDGKKNSDPAKLVFGTSADYAPFEFFKQGKIDGFDIDLMTEIARRLNKEIEFRDMSFDAIIGSLKSERIDGAISAITPTNERRKSVDFSKEYIQEDHVMICKETSPVETVSDLADQTIGVQSGTSHEAYAKEKLVNDVSVTVKSLGKIPDLVQDMDLGRLSGIIIGESEAAAIRKSRGNIKVIPLPGEVGGYAIALPLKSPLTPKINNILLEMDKDGSLARLKSLWLDK